MGSLHGGEERPGLLESEGEGGAVTGDRGLVAGTHVSLGEPHTVLGGERIRETVYMVGVFPNSVISLFRRE